jgi:hypothetical protein
MHTSTFVEPGLNCTIPLRLYSSRDASVQVELKWPTTSR